MVQSITRAKFLPLDRLWKNSTSILKQKNIRYEDSQRICKTHKCSYLIATTEKFRKATGWSPRISFDKILEDTLEYWRKK